MAAHAATPGLLSHALAGLTPAAVLRIVYAAVAASMAMFVGGVVDPGLGATAWAWAPVAVLTAGAAVHAAMAPWHRAPRTAVGVGVPVLLAWRCALVGWALLAGAGVDLRVAVVAAGEFVALVVFPAAWVRVVIPLSESERALR